MGALGFEPRTKGL